MLVDTKFPPGSDWLGKRIGKKFGAPVTIVVNTHYHYDHTQGNTNYTGAKIYAYKTVPEMMRKIDGDWWNNHQSGIPTELVDGDRTIKVGAQDVLFSHPGPAHTRGDIYAYLRRGDKEIVATGDLVFNTYYPFMDLSEAGEDILGLIGAVRSLAARYPNAVFVPGHGPIANAADLVRYADYLQFLYDSVAQARQKGLSEDQAAASIDLSKWKLSRLPSYHSGRLCWATAEMNIRWVYQIETGTREKREDCTF
jgi:glyoxylase-like metal-dependent hydrolase (beta-lactamase superfamily II)